MASNASVVTNSVEQRSRVLVTGASGFVGSALAARLVADGRHLVRAALRRPSPELDASVEQVLVGDLGPETDWRAALNDAHVIVHAAARVHVLREREADPLQAFRRVNVQATMRLARAAAAAGTKRIVFVSSIKVNGERTVPGRPFRADDTTAPTDPYGVSKFEAEEALRKLARETGLEVVVVRAPLVYGPGVKANFAALIRWVRRGVPLPLGALQNRRTLVALDNLVDLLVTCIDHPTAANQTFLAGDAEDLSTSDLLRRIGLALGRPARLLPVPGSWIELAARLLGRQDIAQRLCGSLQVDIGKAQSLLGWTPPVDVDTALRRAVSGSPASLRR